MKMYASQLAKIALKWFPEMVGQVYLTIMESPVSELCFTQR